MQKLIHEPNGFSVSNQQLIAAEPSQLGWWKKALELGFRKRYNLPKAELKKAFKTTAKLRYQELLSVIDTELRPVIEMRNKLAHGQWARPLNSSNTEISTETIAALRNENALTAGFKLSILEHLAIIIHDLVAGNHAFERDFDKHFSNLEDARRNLKTRSYPKWKSSMQDKYDRGRGRRNSNLKT